MQDCQNVVPNIFVIKLVKYLWIYLQKTWTAGRRILKFGVLSNEIVLRKKLENKKILRAAVLCANIFQIFFSTGSSKIFAAAYLRVCSTGPLTFSHPSASLLEFQLILVKILLLLWWVSTGTQISIKSETDLKYFCLKHMNTWSRGVFFLISNFPKGLEP